LSSTTTVHFYLYSLYFLLAPATTPIYTLSLHDALPISRLDQWTDYQSQVPPIQHENGNCQSRRKCACIYTQVTNCRTNSAREDGDRSAWRLLIGCSHTHHSGRRGHLR